MDRLIPVKRQADRVEQSIRRLTRKFQGIGKTLDAMVVVMTDKYAVAATNGTHMFFNPAHTALLDNEQLDSLVMHEALHVLDEHHLRHQGKNLLVWGIACDYKVNYVLTQVDMPINDGMTYSVKYAGMPDEKIYKQLMQESKALMRGS